MGLEQIILTSSRNGAGNSDNECSIANTVSVAEHAMSLILACAKKLIIHDKAQKNGDYGSRDKLHSTELAGKRLG
jgi:lactate dehydrogenase-like 2-hydroxyacid dehydrogenase